MCNRSDGLLLQSSFIAQMSGAVSAYGANYPTLCCSRIFHCILFTGLWSSFSFCSFVFIVCCLLFFFFFLLFFFCFFFFFGGGGCAGIGRVGFFVCFFVCVVCWGFLRKFCFLFVCCFGLGFFLVFWVFFVCLFVLGRLINSLLHIPLTFDVFMFDLEYPLKSTLFLWSSSLLSLF